MHRIYREAGLAVLRRMRRRIGPVEPKQLLNQAAANLSRSMDLVSDGLAGGGRRLAEERD